MNASARSVVPIFRAAAYMLGMTEKLRFNDIVLDAETFAHLRDNNPELPDFAWRIMLGYRPRVNASQWDAVREFTLATAVTLNPTTHDTTRRLMSMSARFHAWLWARTGLELTVDRVYTQNHIDLYLQNQLGRRSDLHRWGVARQLVANGKALTTAELRGLPAPDMALRAPFTPQQIASMNSWANQLTTLKKRQNAWGLLGLCLGAGLRAEEVVHVTIGDIDVDDDVLFVNVSGTRARRVPVRATWVSALRRSIENRPATDNVFRGPYIQEYRPRIIQTFLTDHPAPVRPTPCRLRASWLVRHIENGVPVQILKEMGGFRSFDTLNRYFALARPLDASSYTALLVNGAVNR